MGNINVKNNELIQLSTKRFAEVYVNLLCDKVTELFSTINVTTYINLLELIKYGSATDTDTTKEKYFNLVNNKLTSTKNNLIKKRQDKLKKCVERGELLCLLFLHMTKLEGKICNSFNLDKQIDSDMIEKLRLEVNQKTEKICLERDEILSDFSYDYEEVLTLKKATLVQELIGNPTIDIKNAYILNENNIAAFNVKKNKLSQFDVQMFDLNLFVVSLR